MRLAPGCRHEAPPLRLAAEVDPLLRGYDLATFRHDLIAGITVGLVALPLAMAFAIASGLTPQAGIYCAIVTGFIISALGGSRVQIGGPTGAFVVVVSGIVAEYGVAGPLHVHDDGRRHAHPPGRDRRAGPPSVSFPGRSSSDSRTALPSSLPARRSADFLGLRTGRESVGLPRPDGRDRAAPRPITSAAVGARGRGARSSLVLVTNRFVKHVPGTIVGARRRHGVAVAVARLPVETVGSRFGARARRRCRRSIFRSSGRR